jgi:L-glyceraldehyde 3-phosphate reductase
MTAVIVGASSVEQLESNLATLDRLELSEDELAEIVRRVGA